MKRSFFSLHDNQKSLFKADFSFIFINLKKTLLDKIYNEIIVKIINIKGVVIKIHIGK